MKRKETKYFLKYNLIHLGLIVQLYIKVFISEVIVLLSVSCEMCEIAAHANYQVYFLTNH